MELRDKVSKVLESKKNARQYIKEVKELLPELQEFMMCILEVQSPENNELVQYLLSIIKDTIAGVENEDEVLLRDVLEYGWYALIMDVMEEVERDNI